jgi:hypothetical protein
VALHAVLQVHAREATKADHFCLVLGMRFYDSVLHLLP